MGSDWEVTTLAGMPYAVGNADGIGSEARFNYPLGVAVDSTGNLYVTDNHGYSIRKVTPVGTDWVVSTLAGMGDVAGSADGIGSAARFYFPRGLAVDSTGNLFVVDGGNQTIRKVSPVGNDWVVTTLAGKAGLIGSADGIGSAARFNVPDGVALDTTGNLYAAEFSNHTIRKVTPVGTDWVVTTLAGMAGSTGSADGTGNAARFNVPFGIAADSAGNLYVADMNNHTIRKGCRPLAITSSGASFGSSGSAFGFSLTGPPGQTVVVEASTDLQNWLPIWTNTVTGALEFSDPNSSGYSTRFYRARRP